MSNSDWSSGGSSSGNGNGNGGGGLPRHRVIGHLMANGIHEYLLRVQELGMTDSGDGKTVLNPSLQPVIKALHHVLAGGEVEVNVKHPGHPDLVGELNRRAEDANREAAEINQRAGFYVGIEV